MTPGDPREPRSWRSRPVRPAIFNAHAGQKPVRPIITRSTSPRRHSTLSGRGPEPWSTCIVAAEALTAGTGIARVENVGPIMLGQLHILLGNRCSISLKPVIDLPAEHISVDCYEIPAQLREQLLLRYPADVFPYAAAVSRSIDIDHTIPYLSPDRGGPPGQTRIGNLGPHVRRHHNVKTHGRWQVRQPEPGTWLWRSPSRRIYLVNATGTHPVGNTDYAQTIWHAAAKPSPALVS